MPIVDGFIIGENQIENKQMSGQQMDMLIENYLSRSSMLRICQNKDASLFTQLKSKFSNLPTESVMKNIYGNKKRKSVNKEFKFNFSSIQQVS